MIELKDLFAYHSLTITPDNAKGHQNKVSDTVPSLQRCTKQNMNNNFSNMRGTSKESKPQKPCFGRSPDFFLEWEPLKSLNLTGILSAKREKTNRMNVDSWDTKESNHFILTNIDSSLEVVRAVDCFAFELCARQLSVSSLGNRWLDEASILSQNGVRCVSKDDPPRMPLRRS